MTGLKPLAETPEEFWSNTILFTLANALGYESTRVPVADAPGGMRMIDADPDEVLQRAVEAIWRLQTLEK